MNIMAWNVRGLDSRTRRILYEHCRSFSPVMLGIIEPKISFPRIRQSFWRSINMVPVFQNSRSTRCSNIWIFASPSAHVSVVSSSDQYVAVDLIYNNSEIRLAFVHGSNAYICRRNLWIDLLNLVSPRTVFLGDFNAIRGAHERLSRVPPTDIACREFEAFIDSSALYEPPRSGLFYTWSGRRLLPTHIESVLDRFLMSSEFADMWSSTTWATLPRTTSDHSPIVLVCSPPIPIPTAKRPFRFLDMWKLHKDFQTVVTDSWTTPLFASCPITRTMAKLKRLKYTLKSWNKTAFGDVNLQIAALQQQLQEVQELIANSGYTNDLFDKEVDLQAQLNMILDRKNSLACQQSRVTWLRDGDRNTRFFHNMVKQRRSKHFITHMTINGEVNANQSQIAAHVLQHYSDLFKADDGDTADLSAVDTLIHPSVSQAHTTRLSLIPDADEIQAAVFDLSASSAPGPDGFGGSFYHSCWDIIKVDVIQAIQRFFTHNYLPQGLNSSTLILLPKKEAATCIGDYRPIVLSNFLFKLVSKIMATRLSSVANEIVSPHQFGFIKGRNIHDCITLGSEGVNCMNFSDRGINMACKIDISKAFDTISWRFIYRVLQAFGFPPTFIQRVAIIFESARISILHNGSLHGYFSCQRGVRQGDPLSPILFGVAEDVLSRLFFRSVNTRAFRPMKFTRYAAFPSHLLYADDILVFGKASNSNAASCREILDEYGRLSGQICNVRKSHIYFGKGVTTQLKRSIGRILTFRSGTIPFDYLGVPLFVGRPRANHLRALKDKVIAQFSRWRGTQLSMAGRLCLIKSVIHSSAIHSMLVYRWPSTFHHDLDRACRNFLWSGDYQTKPSCSVSWDVVCSPQDKGGLGLRSFDTINECLISKLAWRIMVSNDFGFPMLRAKYLTKHLRSKWLQQTSSIWTSARGSYARLADEVFCNIGDGTSILFWLDDWLGYKLVDKLNVPDYMHRYLTQSVSDFLYDGVWHFTQNFLDQYPEIVLDILLLPLGDDVDIRYWKPDLHGVVTSHNMFQHLSRRGISVKWGTWIWDKRIPIRRSILCWRILRERLPTIDMLRRRGFVGPSVCSLCADAAESIDHIFWHCDVARMVWFGFLSWFGRQDLRFGDFPSFLVYAMEQKYSPQLLILWKIGILTIVWYLWFSRNRAIWDDLPASSVHILKMTKVAFIEIAQHSKLGVCSSSWTDYVVLRNLGVKGVVAAPPSYIQVRWWPPLPGWIKVNTDGAAEGSPGRAGAGGVFRDAVGLVCGCFHVDGGVGFAFEAELLAAITAIEIAFLRGWHRLWLETDSTYIAGLLSARSWKIPWRFHNSWRMVMGFLDAMDFRVSHIFREGNKVADILASNESPEGWWPHTIPIIQQAVDHDRFNPFYFRTI